MIKVDWVLFDLDNTLLNFDRSSEEAFHWLITHYSDIESHPELYPRYSKINHDLWERREQGLISPEDLKNARWQLFFDEIGLEGLAPEEANRLYFEHIASAVHYVEGAIDILEKLYGQFKLAIVTNGLSEVQRPRLKNSNIEKYFEHIVISDEIGSAKPQNSFFKHSHELIGKPPYDKVLVVGDTLKSDIKGARDFGYRSCWFNHDYLEGDGTVKPDFEIHKLSDLLSIRM